MKAIVLAAALSLLALTPVAHAQGALPEAPVLQGPVTPQVAEQTQPPNPAAECPEQPCLKTVTKKKIVGHKYVKVPIYKTYKTKVPCGDCRPKTVSTEGVDIPAPAPKVVIQEQRIIVKTVPKVEYAPVPPVHLGSPRPVIYEQPQVVRVAPPPPPRVIRAAPCPQPCPRQVSVCGPRPCPVPGYGQHAAVVPNGQPSVGYIAGAPVNAQECVERGGQVVNDGRSCAGYR